MAVISHRTRWAALLIAGAGLAGLAGCGGSSESSSSNEAAKVEHIEGTDLSRVILTPEAAKRLDIRTEPVRQSAGGTVIPYSAVFYETDGETWAYVSPEPLTFVREQIVVDRIDGDQRPSLQWPFARDEGGDGRRGRALRGRVRPRRRPLSAGGGAGP